MKKNFHLEAFLSPSRETLYDRSGGMISRVSTSGIGDISPADRSSRSLPEIRSIHFPFHEELSQSLPEDSQSPLLHSGTSFEILPEDLETLSREYFHKELSL